MALPNAPREENESATSLEGASPSLVPPVVVPATVSRRIGLGAALGVSLGSVTLGIGVWSWSSRHGALAHVGPLVFLAGCALAVAMAMRRLVSGRRAHMVQVGRAGVALDGVPIVGRDHIRAAIVGLDRFGAHVRIDLRGGGDLSIGVSDVRVARAMVEALGFDARRTTATFRAGSRVNESTMGVAAIVAVAIAFGLVCWNVVFAFAAAMVLFLGGLAMPTMVTVGTDGLLVRWAVERKYFPYPDIARVERMPGRVRLHLKSRKIFDVVFRSRDDRDEPAAGQLAERIVEAIERRDASGSRVDVSKLVRPAGVEVRAWMASLAEILSEGTFRDAPITADQLWEIVEDATATTTARAAAAIALRRVVDERGKKRLRVVANATAAPHLRVALEQAADGDDADVEQALTALDRSTERSTE